MSGMAEPIQFAPSWKCGDALTPPATTACPANAAGEATPPMGATMPPTRRHRYRFLQKRHGPGEDEAGEATEAPTPVPAAASPGCTKHLSRRHGPGENETMAPAPVSPASPAMPIGQPADPATSECKRRLRKRHGPGEEDEGEEIAPYNIITPVPGQQAVARVSAATVNEEFYEAADKSGLFTMGAQHGVSR